MPPTDIYPLSQRTGIRLGHASCSLRSEESLDTAHTPLHSLTFIPSLKSLRLHAVRCIHSHNRTRIPPNIHGQDNPAKEQFECVLNRGREGRGLERNP